MIALGSLQKNSQRVLRGGNWINNAQNVRSANRNANSPDNRNHNIGLRLAGALLKFFCPLCGGCGGSINQQWHLFYRFSMMAGKRNQDPQRVSRFNTESLLLGRLYYQQEEIDC